MGVSYLAIGATVAVGKDTPNGKFLEMNYGVAAEQVGFTVNKVSGDSIIEFPTDTVGVRFVFYQITRPYCSARNKP
jgi:hypothetical protein